MSTQFRYQNLGSYRLVLALMVAFSHFLHAGIGPDGLAELVRPFQLGALGVYAFFVVSGYIIASACDQFYTGRTRAFFINRFMRIYPPFLLALGISYLIHFGLNHFDGIAFGHNTAADFREGGLSLKTLVRNLFSVFDRRVAVGANGYYLLVSYVWAIVIELQFYVVAGFTFWASSRVGRDAGAVLRAATAFFVVAWLICIQIWPWPPQLLGFGPLFLFGSVWYFFTRDPSSGQVRNRWLAPFAVITFVMAVTSFFIAMLSVTAPGALESSLCFALLIASFCWLTTTRPLQLQHRRLDAMLGDLSYPVYLNHYVVEVGFRYAVGIHSAGAVLAAMLATLLLSVIASLRVCEQFDFWHLTSCDARRN